MAERLIWNVTVRADGGPQLTVSGDRHVDAYDKVAVLVAKSGELAVDLGPSAAGRTAYPVILPAKPSEKLPYKVGANTINLDEPQFLFAGGVDLTRDPASLTIANSDGEHAPRWRSSPAATPRVTDAEPHPTRTV